jgi:AcrR family transcriptional regulator
LQGSVRRDALLDAAVALVRSNGVQVVSMEAVAERAGVSRPLVYKHFTNRDDLLAAAYRREASKLHGDLAAEVAAAGTVEEMYQALLRGSMRATVEKGPIFVALRAAGGWNRDIRREQRSRDRRTIRAFAAVAARQYGLEHSRATAVTAVLLGALDAILAQWRFDPTEENERILEATYLAMVVGAYSVDSAHPVVADGTPSARRRPGPPLAPRRRTAESPPDR